MKKLLLLSIFAQAAYGQDLGRVFCGTVSRAADGVTWQMAEAKETGRGNTKLKTLPISPTTTELASRLPSGETEEEMCLVGDLLAQTQATGVRSGGVFIRTGQRIVWAVFFARGLASETGGSGGNGQIQKIILSQCYVLPPLNPERVEIIDPYSCGDILGCGHGGKYWYAYKNVKRVLIVAIDNNGSQVYEREVNEEEILTKEANSNAAGTVPKIRETIMHEIRPFVAALEAFVCAQ